MSDAALNDLANAPALISTVLAVTTLVIYGVGSAWYHSLLGISLFLRFASLPAVVLFVTTRRFVAVIQTGSAPSHTDGLGWVALTLYTAVALVEILALATLILERRQSPAIQFKRRRKAHR